MRYLSSALIFGGLHFVASIAGLFIWGGSVMGRFDGRSAGAVDFLLDAAAAVLYFPLVYVAVLIPALRLGGGSIAFVLNSALWAVVLAFLLERFRVRRSA